ncbi:MAG: glycosyltransferase [Bacteroidetes bacterium]|nr:glycosyltransferase [Bacteroidota bacterium]MBS1930860.1 glycosyltransferase [Bacteroidota bacterium]
MKKVLYITYDGLTDPLGQSQIIPYLQGLTKQGYQFTILSFEKKERYHKEGGLIKQITDEAGIFWNPLFFSKNPPILSKIYDRWKMRKMAKKLHRQYKFDLIHCRSYIAAEIGLYLKKKTRVKFLFDMRGFWADEKVDNGQWDLKNPLFKKIYRHYKKKEKEFLLHADAIVSLTEAAKNELLKKQEYKSLDIDVIPCCADLTLFNYENFDLNSDGAFKKQLGISSDQKIIAYLGSVGGWYMTHEMFLFYKQLLEKYPSFIMLFLTKDDPSKVLQEAEAAGIPGKKIMVMYAERKVLPKYLDICDCSIFFIRPTYSKMASSPTKHAELMGMGIPVICNDIGDTGTIINKTNSGLIVEKFTEQEYDKIINQVPGFLKLDKKQIRKAALQHFDLSDGIAKYLQIYNRVIGI